MEQRMTIRVNKIEGYNGGTPVIEGHTTTFNNVADMKAAGGLSVGIKCRTLDGGGNDYEIVAAGTGSNYGFLFEQLTVSGLEAKLLGGGIMEDKTVYIPTDYATLQEAIDDLSKISVSSGAVIDLMIESGHQPASGVIVENGDYGHFKISSQSPEVTVASTFSRSINFIQANNARAPVLNCLVDGATFVGGGYRLNANSLGVVSPGCGVKNVWGTGSLVTEGSSAYMRGSIFTGAAQNGGTGAGITSYGSVVFAEGADVGGSKYYGAQAAHGGILNIDNGNADGAFRYGLRATDAGYMSADGATANNCGDPAENGTGLGIWAFNQSTISARNATANGCLQSGVQASGASLIHVRGGSFDDCGVYGVFSGSGSTVDATETSANRSGEFGYRASAGSTITAPNSSAIDCGSTNTQGALFAEAASTIYALNIIATGSSGFAIYAIKSSKVEAGSSTLTGAGNRAIYTETASEVNISNADASGAGSFGILATNGSKINCSDANLRRGATDSNEDIDCRSGSIINAAGATGGVSKAVNTLTSAGIIFQ